MLLILAGSCLTAIAVYLLLAPERGRRLAGLMLLGDALAVMIVAANPRAPAALHLVLLVLVVSFALFAGYALLSAQHKRDESGP